MVKSGKNTICDTCAQNSWRYEFFYVSANTVVISRKTVKSAKNTICDISAQISRTYEFCDIFAHTFVISRKTVKSAKNTTCDTWCTELEEIWVLWYFCLNSSNKQ